MPSGIADQTLTLLKKDPFWHRENEQKNSRWTFIEIKEAFGSSTVAKSWTGENDPKLCWPLCVAASKRGFIEWLLHKCTKSGTDIHSMMPEPWSSRRRGRALFIFTALTPVLTFWSTETQTLSARADSSQGTSGRGIYPNLEPGKLLWQ